MAMKTKRAKGRVLDEFCETTQLERKRRRDAVVPIAALSVVQRINDFLRRPHRWPARVVTNGQRLQS